VLPHSGSSRLPWKIVADKLVGGLALVGWNHGILNDFPFRKGNGKNHPKLTNSYYLSEGLKTPTRFSSMI
jgi:hypothetical protein